VQEHIPLERIDVDVHDGGIGTWSALSRYPGHIAIHHDDDIGSTNAVVTTDMKTERRWVRVREADITPQGIDNAEARNSVSELDKLTCDRMVSTGISCDDKRLL
jgi:hypothetical protein